MSASNPPKSRKQFEIDKELVDGLSLLSKHWSISEREIVQRSIRRYFREAARRVSASTKWGEEFLRAWGKVSVDEAD